MQRLLKRMNPRLSREVAEGPRTRSFSQLRLSRVFQVCKGFHRPNSHRRGQLEESRVRSSRDLDRRLYVLLGDIQWSSRNDIVRTMQRGCIWSSHGRRRARQRATAIVDPRRSTWAPIGHAVAAVDDKRDTPISLMTSVNDFELFHTISGGLRYRRWLACAGSYDKTSAFRSLETTPFRGPRVLSCRPALSSSGRARRQET